MVYPRATGAVLVLAVLLTLAGCGDDNGKTETPPTPEAHVITVKRKSVSLERTYPARAEAVNDVEVKARVQGTLLARNYVEGERVKAGDILFQIDPDVYQARVKQAKANLDRSHAQLRETKRQWKRISTLYKRKTVSAQQLDQAQSQMELAQADVANAEAALTTAQIDLGYTRVEAPISGTTGMRAVSNGNVVDAGTLLTTVRQLDPIYAQFSIPEEDAVSLRRNMGATGDDTAFEGKLVTRVVLPDGSSYAKSGKIDFIAAYVDPQTSTVQARAEFPNPDGELMPGQFLRISVSGIQLKNAVVIPAAAVIEGSQGPAAYVVDGESRAQSKPIRLGPTVEKMQVVEDGLKAGDRVIVNGLPSIKPGEPVKIVLDDKAAREAAGDGTPEAVQ